MVLLAVTYVRVQRETEARADADEVLERYRVTLVSVGDGVVATNGDGIVTFANDVAARAMGRLADDVVGHPIANVMRLVNTQTRLPVDSPALRAVREGRPVSLTSPTLVATRDGTAMPIDGSSAPIRASDGRAAGAVLVFRDASERERHAQRSDRQSGQLGQLAEVANLVNAAQDVRSVAWARDRGRPRNHRRRVCGDTRVARHGRRARARGRGPCARTRQRGTRRARAWRNAPCGELTVTMRCTREQLEADPEWRRFLAVLGRTVTSGWMGAPLVGRDGRHLGVLHLFSRSSTAFTDQDESILTQLARLAANAIENAWLSEELREGDRRKDEFLATLAHELRNPLAPMSNVVEIIKRSTNSDARADAVSVLERQLRQMVRLIDDLLDISRITKGRLELRPRPRRPGNRDPLRRRDIAAVDRGPGHQLVVSLPLEPVYLQADQARLSQVVANLLHNAAKYSEHGGTIEVSLEATAREATVRVRDSGLGIAPELLPRVSTSSRRATTQSSVRAAAPASG